MSKPDKVILLRTAGTAVSLSADAAELPRRIKILNWGDNPNCHGRRVNVGPLFLKCLAAPEYPYRKVALDFEHNTFPGTAAYRESREPRPASGFAPNSCARRSGPRRTSFTGERSANQASIGEPSGHVAATAAQHPPVPDAGDLGV